MKKTKKRKGCSGNGELDVDVSVLGVVVVVELSERLDVGGVQPLHVLRTRVGDAPDPGVERAEEPDDLRVVRTAAKDRLVEFDFKLRIGFGSLGHELI